MDYVEIPAQPSEVHALLTSLQPRGAILYWVPDAIAKVVRTLGIPAIGMGWPFPEIPSFFVNFSSLLAHAFKQVRAVGHRRIVAPFWNMGEPTYERLAEKVEKHLSKDGVSLKRHYNLPSLQGETTEDYHAALHEISRYTPPSCIILFDLSHYLAVSSFLMGRRLRIPDDISLILVSCDPILVNVLPSIAHFLLYSDADIMQAFHALQEQMGGLLSAEKVEHAPVWVAGESLAPFLNGVGNLMPNLGFRRP